MQIDGYVRVSRVGYRSGERFISPAVQRETIENWAKARGATVLEIWEELDESGGSFRRPLLESAVRRIEADLSDGLVVASIDRFGRSVVDGIGMVERIHRAGGGFFSVADGLDSTTDTGRLVLEIMLSIAAHYRRQARASWEIATRKAIARGVFTGSQAPLGYRRTRSGRLRPVPAVAPLITEAFERRAAGASLSEVARFLEAHGIRTVYGNPRWMPETMSRLIRNRVYVGEVHSGRYVKAGAHPALVEEALWQAAQGPRRHVVPAGRQETALSGLVRCASCGRKMAPAVKPDRHNYYACRRTSAAGVCPQPASITAVALEAGVQDVVLDVLGHRRQAPLRAIERAEQRVIQAQRSLAAYRDSDRVFNALGEQAFAAGLARRVQTVRETSLELVAARERGKLHSLPPSHQLEDAWPTLTISQRRQLIGDVIDCVFVLPGKRQCSDRVWVCPKGTQPSGLPRTGNHRARLQQIKRQRRWLGLRYDSQRPQRWSEARLERELREFTRQRRVFPTQRSFEEAGRSRLYRQMQLHGGEAVWATRLALPLHRSGPKPWTEATIRAALAEYLLGRETWPSKGQFHADGRKSLHDALGRRGGATRWAAEFGLQLANPHWGHVPYWTDDRIRERLPGLCAGRSVFPTRREFQAAGLGGMFFAMRRQQALNHWAQQMGLPRKINQHAIR